MTDDLQSGASDLVAQAAAWRLASLLLECPRNGWINEVERLSCEISDARLSSSATRASEGTEENYHRLFGPGGAVSPREASYCGFEDPGRLMAELAAFYGAFSFQPRREEPLDHVSVEAGFLGYLFLKEAYARIQEDSQAAEITRSARERFTNEHVGRCAQGMIQRLSDVSPYLKDVLSWIAEKAQSRAIADSPSIELDPSCGNCPR